VAEEKKDQTRSLTLPARSRFSLSLMNQDVFVVIGSEYQASFSRVFVYSLNQRN